MGIKRRFRSALALGCLSLPVTITGCAARVDYRVHDPYHGDYHTWDDHERAYYRQWAVETHHDPNRDYRKLNHKDQKEYWDWRHGQPDRH